MIIAGIILLIGAFLFIFNYERKLGEARIVQVYDLKEGTNLRHDWRTVIQCLETNRRHIIGGKVGYVDDTYMSAHC